MLNEIHSPAQLKGMTVGELEKLAGEIRTELINTVAECGGHLASNLGIVELTLAIHYVFDCPKDRLFFDVGHQCYPHKMLTGRFDRMDTLRKEGGLSGFPDPEESEYDCFVAGHASTAISAALGAARARDLKGETQNVIAVVGDGALTGGMCYEALNDAGQSGTRLIVILNDNEMSISKNVGAMSRYLNGLRQSRSYRGFKRGVRRALERIPHIGARLFRFVEKLRDAVKSLFIDGRFFEALGFVYIGPIDGHNIKHLIRILNRAKTDTRPLLIHVATQKGRGYEPAEEHPDVFHGVAPFYVDSGRLKSNGDRITNGEIAADELKRLAEGDRSICVVTAAMPDGTGMHLFEEKHPKRFFDVGIAEEHAVTMAAGLASEGMRPYIALYSTFLQRCYDQIMIDVCRCRQPVTFLLDRAGFSGADGRTHQGLYDLSYLRTIPNMTICAPRDAGMLKELIAFSRRFDGPLAIRYPKEVSILPEAIAAQAVECGKWQRMTDRGRVAIIACGQAVAIALDVRDRLEKLNIKCGVIDAVFIKPIDEEILLEEAGTAQLVVTLEENDRIGGLGEAVAALFTDRHIDTPLLRFGAPDDFIAHARISRQRKAAGMDAEDISAAIEKALKNGEQNEKMQGRSGAIRSSQT